MSTEEITKCRTECCETMTPNRWCLDCLDAFSEMLSAGQITASGGDLCTKCYHYVYSKNKRCYLFPEECNCECGKIADSD